MTERVTGRKWKLNQQCQVVFIVDKTTCHRMFIVYFADKKSTIDFCFVSCYCIVVDDVNKQIGFYGNALPLVNNAH